MARNLGYFTSSGEKISKAESEKRFPKKKKSSSRSSSSTPTLTFENAPPGYTLNNDGTIRPEGSFNPNQTVTQTVQNNLPPREQPSPTANTIRTPATQENLSRLEENPQEFNREVVRRDRERRVKEDINNLIREEIKKPFTPNPKTTGEIVKQQRETVFPNTIDSRAEQLSEFTATYNPVNIIPRTFAKTKLGKKAKELPGKESGKLQKQIITLDIAQSRGQTNFFQDVETFRLGAKKGVVDVVDTVVNYEDKILAPLSFAIAQPRETFSAIDRGLSMSGEKIRTASLGEQGVFLGEFAASAGVETAAYRGFFRPLKELVSAKTSKNFRGVKEVPVTRESDVGGFTRTNTRVRKPGEPLPDDFVVATDDYVVVRNEVQGFKRNIKTGETELVIENNPYSTGTTDIFIKGNTASTAESLGDQFARAGTTTDLVSAQRGLVQEPGNVFGRFTNEKTFTIDKPNPDPVERSLFFSPEGQVRTSRLGIDEVNVREPNLVDLATDNFGQRPEIIIKPDTKIADFPKDLQPGVDFIIKKGRQREGESVKAAVGRVRGELETKYPGFERKITEFQIKTKGEPTTPGFFSSESEQIFSFGQEATLKRTGTTFIGGRKVKIFEETGLQPNSLSDKEVAGLASNPALRESVGDQFVRSIIAPSKSRRVDVVETPARPGFTLSGREEVPSSTTRSLTGLEPYTPPKITTKSSAPSDSLSRNFVAPNRLPIVSTSATRTPDVPLVSPSPRIPRRERRRGGGGSARVPIIPPSIISPPPSDNRARPRNPPRITPSYRTTPRRTPSYTLPPLMKLPRLKSDRGSSTFTTQVFKKGKFVNIGRSDTKQKAFNLGSRTVGSSALRTFRITRGGTPINLGSTGKFRRSKSQSFAVVERSKYAINTPGELFEIPGAKKKRKRRR